MSVTKQAYAALVASLLISAATPSLAANNFANTAQTGTDNSGTITQGPGDGNDVGTEVLAARQLGDDNDLIIVQSGDDNAVGTEATGLLQSEDRNSADITQSSSENTLRWLTQTGLDGGAGTASLRRNAVLLVQETGDGNIVSGISQTRWAVSDGLAGNTASVTQSGAGNVLGAASGNAVGLSQSGYAQSATLVQDGDANSAALLQQTGPGNSLFLSFTGNGNGVSDFTVPVSIPGMWAGLMQGTAIQNSDLSGTGASDGNFLSLVATGNNTGFAFNQTGARNSVVGTITADDNQVGVLQMGDDNSTSFTMNGTGNRASVLISSGNDNAVTLEQNSALSGNIAAITIAGDANGVDLDQAGDSTAIVDIHGDNNHLDASQLTGSNLLTLTLWGNNNNAPGLGFSGVALVASAMVDPDLVPGRVIQDGAGNTITYTLGANGALSSSNLFAFKQTGNDNTIIGSTMGNDNQVVIVQAGAANLVHFSQTGNGNIIGISQ